MLLQCSRTKSEFFLFKKSTVICTSSFELMPVDSINGLPVSTNLVIKGILVKSADATLYAGTSKLSKISILLKSHGVHIYNMFLS